MIASRLITCALGLALLAGCQELQQGETAPTATADAPAAEAEATPEAAEAPEDAAETEPTPEELAAADAARAVEAAPRIYMALQPDPSGPTSIVFAIDQAKDDTPLNDPAIRLTPEQGQCNPQEMRGYSFPPETLEKPVFGPTEAASGITARELPNFMAVAVTAEMLRQGLIEKPEESQPQNVCTRKLWEQLILNQSTG